MKHNHHELAFNALKEEVRNDLLQGDFEVESVKVSDHKINDIKSYKFIVGGININASYYLQLTKPFLITSVCDEVNIGNFNVDETKIIINHINSKDDNNN